MSWTIEQYILIDGYKKKSLMFLNGLMPKSLESKIEKMNKSFHLKNECSIPIKLNELIEKLSSPVGCTNSKNSIAYTSLSFNGKEGHLISKTENKKEELPTIIRYIPCIVPSHEIRLDSPYISLQSTSKSMEQVNGKSPKHVEKLKRLRDRYQEMKKTNPIKYSRMLEAKKMEYQRKKEFKKQNSSTSCTSEQTQERMEI